MSAPVFGGKGIAETGKLVFALGGPSKATTLVKPLIDGVMGRKVIECGEEARRAAMLKIAGYVPLLFGLSMYGRGLMWYVCRNIITVNMMEAVGESQVFAEKTGLGTGPMEELITEAFGAVAGGYSQRYFSYHPNYYNMNMSLTIHSLTTGAYAPPLDTRPGFGVSLAIKDADHAFAVAKEQGVELPGLEMARENMVKAREYGGECLDSSSMYGILRQKAGLEFWNEKSRKGN